ncbi:phage tail fiber domain-containing protein, partial [Herbiconiux daphne]
MAVLTTIATYVLDGTTTKFTVPFEYLSRAFVEVSLRSTTGSSKQLTVVTDFVWNSQTEIEILATLDTTGFDQLEIRRNTSTT